MSKNGCRPAEDAAHAVMWSFLSNIQLRNKQLALPTKLLSLSSLFCFVFFYCKACFPRSPRRGDAWDVCVGGEEVKDASGEKHINKGKPPAVSSCTRSWSACHHYCGANI